jgi:surface polysaccharide O-acyltransferase-like enzyme
LLLYVRRLPVPAPLRSLAVTLSAASFTIYMVHNIPINVLQTRLHFDRPLITILIAIAVGFAVHVAVTRLSAMITRVVRR